MQNHCGVIQLKSVANHNPQQEQKEEQQEGCGASIELLGLSDASELKQRNYGSNIVYYAPAVGGH